MKKKILTLSFAFLFLFTVFPINTQAQQSIQIIIDGNKIQSDVSPFLENGRTMVPIRIISENLGYDVEWNEKRQSISIRKEYQGYTPDEHLGLYIGKPLIVRFNTTAEYVFFEKAKNGEMSIDEASNRIAESAEYISIDVAPKIIDGVTFVPLRSIAEMFGLKVSWSEQTWTVTINNQETSGTSPSNTTLPYELYERRVIEELSKEVEIEVIDN